MNRQGGPSPAGLSKLPYELLCIVFHDLCGKETLAVRAVCTEWELASRPFFAERYLSRSLFWLTPAGLDQLEAFAYRFAPYMHQIFISTDCFTLTGLCRCLRRHLRCVWVQQAPTWLKPKRTSSNLLYFSRRYLMDYRLPGDRARTRHFCVEYARTLISQLWLRWTGDDRVRLCEIVKLLSPQAEVHVAEVGYAPHQLSNNIELYGRAAPRHALKFALFGAKNGVFSASRSYAKHVKNVVRVAVQEREQYSTKSTVGP